MISVAMTTYNGAEYIEQQLLSILQQTHPVDEIIICDDGSKDNTVDIIKDIIQKNKVNNIRLISNDVNLGYIRNFYKAVSLTNGDYIFLADQDDIWHLDKIEKTLAVMKETKAAAVCTKSNLIDKYGYPVKEDYIVSVFLSLLTERLKRISFFDLVIENVAQGCTYCFTKEVKEWYMKVNSTNLIHDHQILFIASLLGEVYAYNEELIDYRLHGANSAGLQKSDKDLPIEFKKPKKVPSRVLFLRDLKSVRRVPCYMFYAVLYYLRIPYFVSVIRRRNLGRKN